MIRQYIQRTFEDIQQFVNTISNWRLTTHTDDTIGFTKNDDVEVRFEFLKSINLADCIEISWKSAGTPRPAIHEVRNHCYTINEAILIREAMITIASRYLDITN